MAPPKMKAIVTAGVQKWELKEVEVPRPGPKEILVKVTAAAQNPADCQWLFLLSPVYKAMLKSLVLYREERLVLAY